MHVNATDEAVRFQPGTAAASLLMVTSLSRPRSHRTHSTVVTLDHCQHPQSSAKRFRSGPTRNDHALHSLPIIRSLLLSLVVDLFLPAGAHSRNPLKPRATAQLRRRS